MRVPRLRNMELLFQKEGPGLRDGAPLPLDTEMASMKSRTTPSERRRGRVSAQTRAANGGTSTYDNLRAFLTPLAWRIPGGHPGTHAQAWSGLQAERDFILTQPSDERLAVATLRELTAIRERPIPPRNMWCGARRGARETVFTRAVRHSSPRVSPIRGLRE